MEASSATLPDLHQPFRSISLPSRIHPISVKSEAALNHLKSWKTSSISIIVPFGAETLQIGLVGLAELYNCVQESIQSPLTQRAILHYQNGKLVEEALDGSVILLDTCDTARNLLLTMKEHLQNLQSAFRRRGRDSSNESKVDAYFTFRKKARKEMTKCFQALKKIESKVCFFSPILDADHHLSMVVKVLREAMTITISIFRSLLLFLSAPMTKTKVGGFSLISKLIPIRSSSFSEKGKKIMNEAESVDFALYSFHEHSRSSRDAKAEVQMVQKMLKNLNDSIDGLEAGLDSMLKCLIQNRVSFLNILTNH